MKVLGVDPGLVRTGWAVVEGSGVRYQIVSSGLISPRPDAEISERLALGYQAFQEVLRGETPDLMVLEEIFSVPGHPRSALQVAHMRGVLCLAAGQQRLRVESMSATSVKQRLTGNGHASKYQVREMVFRLCSLRPRKVRSDLTDAVALAVAGLNQFG